MVVALAAAVLAFIFIVPEKKRAHLGRFGKLLHDTLNFRYLIIEKVLQALYIFATAYAIAYGFFMLFYFQRSFYGSISWRGGYGLLVMILGPVAIRIVYELLIMAVLLVKNVISINNKLTDQNEETGKDDVFTIPDLKDPDYAPAAPVAPVAPVVQAAPAAPVAPEAPATPAAQPETPPSPAPEAAPAAPAGCPNCGALGENGIFCTKCGTRLK